MGDPRLLNGLWIFPQKFPMISQEDAAAEFEGGVAAEGREDGAVLIDDATVPVKSTEADDINLDLDIYSVSLLSDRLEAWPLDLFQVKAVQLPILSRNGSFTVFPLHFENPY